MYSNSQIRDLVAALPFDLLSRIVRTNAQFDILSDADQKMGWGNKVLEAMQDDLWAQFRTLYCEAQEHLLLLCRDVHNHISGVHTVHIGTTSSCVIKVADILRVALLANASRVILAHNHPSGDPTPSPEDILATKEVAAAGFLLDIRLLDHLVVTDERTRFTSLATIEKGIFNRGYSWT